MHQSFTILFINQLSEQELKYWGFIDTQVYWNNQDSLNNNVNIQQPGDLRILFLTHYYKMRQGRFKPGIGRCQCVWTLRSDSATTQPPWLDSNKSYQLKVIRTLFCFTFDYIQIGNEYANKLLWPHFKWQIDSWHCYIHSYCDVKSAKVK